MESYCGFIKAGARSKSQLSVSLSNWCMRREHLNHIPYLRKIEQEKIQEKSPGLHDKWMEKFRRQHIPRMLMEHFQTPTSDEFVELECYKRYRTFDGLIIGSEQSQRPLDITRCSKNICFRPQAGAPLKYAEVWCYVDLKERGKGAIIKEFTDVSVDVDTRTVLFKGRNQPTGPRTWISLDKIVSIVGIIKQTWVETSENGSEKDITDYYLVTDANQFD